MPPPACAHLHPSPVIYTIGLGSNGGVYYEFLRRVSNNDPLSPIYYETKPSGVYVYAPTPTDLNYAFVRIASEISASPE